MRFALVLIVMVLGSAGARAQEAANGQPQQPAEVRFVAGWNGDASDASGRPSRRWRRKRQGPDVGIRIRFNRPFNVWDVKGAFTIDGEAIVLWDEAWQETKDIVRVPAQLKPGRTYTIEFADRPAKPGMQRIEQGKHTFTVPGGPPALRFVGATGSVIERKSRQLVHLVVRNTDQVRLEATAVPLHALVSGAPELPTSGALDTLMTDWAGQQDRLKAAAGGPFAGLFEDKMLTEKEIFSEPGPRDRERRISLPLAWRSAMKGGRALLVRAFSLEKEKGEGGETDLALWQVTDLAVSVKRSEKALVVWATELSTGQVVKDARVFLSVEGGALVAAGATDADGVLVVKAGEKKPALATGEATVADAEVDLAKVQRVFALTDDDRTFADLEEKWQVPVPSRIDRSAKAQVLTRAHAFTERGVYRPGDAVRFKATLRTFRDGEAGLPDGAGKPEPSVLVWISDPKGKRVLDLKLAPTEFGTVSGSLRTRASDPLGLWMISVGTLDGKTVWGSTTYRVEEYQPPRHKVEVSFKEKEIQVDEGLGARKSRKVVEAIVQGVYYAGGPVKHGKVRWRVELEGTRHETGEKGFAAGTDLPGEAGLLESGEAVLDAKGGVAIEIPLSPEVLDGRRALDVSATVLDFDARAATGSGRFAVKPAVLVGIAGNREGIDSGDSAELQALVIGKDGKKLATGDLTVAVLDEQWTSVQKRNEDGDFYWTGESMMVKAFELPAKIENGVAPIRVTFTRGGKHQIQVAYKDADGTVYRSTTTIEVNWGDSDAEGENWQAEKLRRVSLSLDRSEYVPGETAKLRIRTPRAATSMLLTVEREDIVLVKRVTLKEGETVVELPVDPKWLPNVYVSLIATHPREAFPLYAAEADTQAPGFSAGYASLPVRAEHTALKVALEGAGPDASAKPGDRHTVKLSVKDKDGKPVEAEVALAVVDEAVLSLTGFATPTLDELFRVLFPLSVSTYDVRMQLALQTPYRAFNVRPLTGGDGGSGGLSKPREWFDPVAFFQPDLRTDANGEASVTFTLPDSMTTYRVYALAVDKGPRHGSAAQALLVRKPFYLEPGLPRFFTQGDKGTFHVAVFNGTGADGEVKLSVTATPGLTVAVPEAQQKLAANDRTRFPVAFEATAPGHVKLEFRASMGKADDAVSLALPVRSRYVPRTQAVDGALQASASEATAKLDLPAEARALPAEVAREAKASVEVSSLASLRMIGGLRHLLRYPYGCAEQTASGVLPLAALREMIGSGLVPQISAGEADGYLRPGVDRLLSMQTSRGGFGYWPGDTTEHPWASAYATLALAQARRAGVAVPDVYFAKALEYLQSLVGARKSEAGAGEQPDPVGVRSARPFAHWVLASEGRAADPGRELRADAQLSREQALFLLMAMARAGQAADAKRELAKLIDRKSVPGTFDPWTFYSPVRARAIELLAVAEIDPKSPKSTALMGELFRAVRPEGAWQSTQDNAWCVTALGRTQALSAPSGEVTAIVSVDGKREVGETLRGTANPTLTVALDTAHFLQDPTVKIKKEGAAVPLFYRVEATYPWRGPDVGAKDAALQRTYKRLAGEGPIKVGDLVEVTLVGRLSDQRHYLALTDPLPAGLVAVNSALQNEGKLPAKRPEDEEGWQVGGEWIWSLSPDHLELRDDRVMAFRDYAWRGAFRFSYVARAVCEGTFAVPPAKVEPMYQPEQAAFSTEASLRIEAAAP